jgi:enoyl-CoA hydratase/carnithine racemase
MNYADLIVQKKNKVGIISINRPKFLNSLSMTTMDEIISAFKEMDADPEINVVIFKGEGRAFCTGHNLDDLRGKERTEEARVFRKPSEIIRTIQGMRKPVIASIQGYALAVGFGLIGACDIIIAAEKTRVQCPGANFGIVCGTPDLGIYRSLPRKKVLELNFTAEMVDIGSLEQFGFVNKIVPADQLEAATMAMAEKIANNAPLAVQSAKQLFYTLDGIDHAQTGNMVADIMAANADTEDAKEAVVALIEKRAHKPFIGK